MFGLLMMLMDKRRAIKREYRIAESTIWSVAIFGGALGATMGMHLFRHKTKKGFFIIGLPLLIILNIIIVSFVTLTYLL